MLFRQKLAFFVFGCVFVIVGQVVTGPVVPSATAQGALQDAEFGTVTAKTVRVRGDDGAWVHISAGKLGASVTLRAGDGGAAVVIGVLPGEASVIVGENTSNENVVLRALADAGAQVGITRGDTLLARAFTNDRGGLVAVYDTHGEPQAGVLVDDSGEGVLFLRLRR